VELRQLLYFESVARCGGFTRAAEQLHVAQSAVSAQIRALESELGTSLLARTTRRVTLTHAGELFLGRAQRVLAELDGARGDLADLGAVLRGRVVIGATQVLGTLDFPSVLAHFHTAYPGVELVLRSDLIAQLLTALDAGDLDLVLGPVHPDLSSRHAAQALFAEELLLVTPPSHPLARSSHPVTLAAVREEPFVCLPAGSGLRVILDAAAAAAGVQLRVPFETHSPYSIRELVSAGLGVGLLARSVARSVGPPIAVSQLAPTPPHPPIGVIHHRDHRLTPAAHALRRHLQRFASLPPDHLDAERS
jgi:LysR family transcriptional activator of glutamate synthase operon